MKKLSALEFQEECKTLALRGKCSVLVNGHVKIDKFITDCETILKELNISKSRNYKNADEFLINFQVSPSLLFFKFDNMMHQLLKYTSDELDIVVTVTYAKNISDDTTKITIISMKNKLSYIFKLKIFKTIDKIFKAFKRYFNIQTEA